jgi:hypothetical protein
MIEIRSNKHTLAEKKKKKKKKHIPRARISPKFGP